MPYNKDFKGKKIVNKNDSFPKKKYSDENRSERKKSTSSFNDDKDELAPPRFLPKKDSQSFSDKPKRAYNSDRPFNKDKKYGDNKSTYSKSSYSDRKQSNSRDYKKKWHDKHSDGFKKEGGFERKNFNDKSNFGERKDGFKSRKPFDKDKKSYGDKPAYGDRKDGFKSRKPFDREKRTYGDKPKSYEKNNFKKEDGDGFKKPFRPKYDPEIKLKKTYKDRQEKDYRERKKALTEPEPKDSIRLNKYIANSGICSRREADELIQEGHVTVNGEVVKEMGHKVKPTDKVQFKGKTILPEPYVYILMNKPKDFITTTDDDKGRKTVMDLLADKVKERVYPIGRLDRNTTGVLLITNDGEVSQKLTHPSFEIKKVYHAELDKKMTNTDLDKLVEGFELEDGFVHADAAAFVEVDDKKHVGIEIHSGKNRVVRRMFEHLGYEVEKLDRISFGIFTKKDLPRGKWRHLSQSEVGFLMKLKVKK